MNHDSLSEVKNIVLVLSGKGGVGKSSITTQLALSLALSGKSVGVLDIDLTGPSIPRFFGIEDRQVHQSSNGWIPVLLDPPPSPSPSQASPSSPLSAEGHDPATNGSTVLSNGDHGDAITGSVCCMSIGFLLKNRGDAVVWRGPKKTAMIRQFLTDVVWGALDYLLIDTPPGTSDEHISVVESLRTFPRVRGAILVTTPQEVSTADVRKELGFCRKVGIGVLGVVENMSGYVCPCCDEVTNIFSSGGGEEMARRFGVPFLGKVPIEPRFVQMIEEGQQQKQQQPENKQNGGSVMKDMEQGGTTSRRPSLLQRYRDLPQLYGLFRDMTDRLVKDIEGEQLTHGVAQLAT